MKKTLYYIFLLAFGFMTNACKDNENWTIVEPEIQQGVYITGDATIFSGAVLTSKLEPAKLDIDFEKFPDRKETHPDLVNLFVWLNAEGSFNITIAKDNNVLVYGKGAEVSATTAKTVYTLTEGKDGFKVEKAGLYNIVVNSTLKEVSIISAKWGIIGAATPGGWDGETPFGEPVFNDKAFTVEWTLKTVMASGEYKFRYSGTWGQEINYGSGQEKIYTDVTGTVAEQVSNLLAKDFNNLETGLIGGKGIVKYSNLNSKVAGEYSLTLKYDMRTKTYAAKAIQPTGPSYPDELFFIGDAYKGWDNWADAGQMIPVNGTAGAFWKIMYLKAGSFKFSPVKAWKGDFGIATKNTTTIGEYSKGGENISVDVAGCYLVYIDLKTDVISVTVPKVILKGDVANGGWDSSDQTDLFTINAENAKELLMTVPKAGKLRMCISHPLLPDWWRAEFNVFSGKIEYRGAGNDQAEVPVTAGQKITLNFDTETGSIQ